MTVIEMLAMFTNFIAENPAYATAEISSLSGEREFDMIIFTSEEEMEYIFDGHNIYRYNDFDGHDMYEYNEDEENEDDEYLAWKYGFGTLPYTCLDDC